MANWDKEVLEKLGPVVFKLIRDYVTNHVTNIDVMNDIAQILSDGAGGANQRRRGGFDERAMRDILSDWYNEEMHKMTREAAVKRLIAVFKDNSVNLKPLAHALEQKLRRSMGSTVLLEGKLYGQRQFLTGDAVSEVKFIFLLLSILFAR